MFSGAGADELFAGYHRHYAFHYYLKHRRFFQLVLPLLKVCSRWMPTGLAYPGRKSVRQIKKFCTDIAPSPQTTFINFTGMTGFQFLRQKSDTTPYSSIQALSDALQYDQHNYLIGDVLTLTDKTSMAQSLEVRLPYLDVPLLDLAAQIPGDFLLQKGPKWMLKKMLQARGGEIFCQRRKEGFGVPLGHWVRQTRYKHLLDPIFDAHNPLYEWVEQRKVMQLMKAHLSGRQDHGSEVTSLLILTHWLVKEFGK